MTNMTQIKNSGPSPEPRRGPDGHGRSSHGVEACPKSGDRATLSARWCPFPFGTAQQVANSSREGTTRTRFRLGASISQPLSEFALLGSMDLAYKLPHAARSQLSRPPRSNGAHPVGLP